MNMHVCRFVIAVYPMQAEFVRVSHPDHDFRVAAEYAVVNLSNVVERYGTDNYRLL